MTDDSLSEYAAPMNSTDWESRDAWVLSALPRRGDLSEVIGGFDALNHDIIPREELEASLRRLGGAKLVTLGDRISVTREGRRLLRRGKGRGMIDFAQSMENVVAAVEPPATLPDWSIDESAYEAAYQCYRASMAKFMRRGGSASGE